MGPTVLGVLVSFLLVSFPTLELTGRILFLILGSSSGMPEKCLGMMMGDDATLLRLDPKRDESMGPTFESRPKGT